MKLNNIWNTIKTYCTRLAQASDKVLTVKEYVFLIFMKVFHSPSWLIIPYLIFLVILIITETIFPAK